MSSDTRVPIRLEDVAGEPACGGAIPIPIPIPAGASARALWVLADDEPHAAGQGKQHRERTK